MSAVKTKPVDLKAVFRAVAPRKSTTPIIQDLAVKDGKAITTNLDMYAIVPTELPDGMYRLVGQNFEAYPEGAGPALDNFPVSPPMEGAVSVEIPFPREAFKAALNFETKNPARPFWGAACFRVLADRMEMVVTDQFALCRYVLDKPVGLPEGEYLMKIEALRVVLLDKSATTLTFSVVNAMPYGSHAQMSTEGLSVITRRIEGAYYTVDNVIPKYLESTVMFDAKEFKYAIKTLEPYIDPKTYAVEISVADDAYDTLNRDPFKGILFDLRSKNPDKHLDRTITLGGITGYNGSMTAKNIMLIMPMSAPKDKPESRHCFIQHRYLKRIVDSVTKPYIYMGIQSHLGDLRAVTFSGEPLTGGDQA